MRILSLDLLAYGPFTARTLDFSRGMHGLHLVYGPNEAGKSAALRALISFFYGIHPQTPDNFVHDYDALRIGARLRLSDGTEHSFIRRKGSRNTLMDEAGSTLSESEMVRFLDNVSQETFTRMYGIDSSSLVEGGKKLVQGEGELGAVLFAAVSGIPEVREIVAGLEKEAAVLFKPTGTTPVINRLISEYRELKKACKGHSLSAVEWSRLEDRIREAVERRDALSRRVREKTALANRRRRVHEAFKDAGELREIQAELDAMAGTVILPSGFAARRERAEEKLKEAREAIAADTRELAHVQEEIAVLSTPDGLLAHRERITGLFQLSGNYKQACEQLPRLKGNLLEIERSAGRILRDLHLRAGGSDLGEYCPSIRDRTRIEELCEAYRDLVTAREHQGEILAKYTAALAALGDRIQPLPESRDVSGLEDLLNDCRRSGISERGVQSVADRVKSLETTLSAGMERLGLKGVGFQDLLSLPLPGKQTVNLFARDFMALQQQITETGNREKEERLTLSRTIDDIRALQIQGDIPTEDQLARIRERRDFLWGLIRKAWEGGRVDVPEELWRQEGGTGADAPEAFERAVAAADEISDRLRRESDRVARLARLVAGREGSQRILEEIVLRKQGFEDRMESLLRKWEEIWRPAGIEPGSPEEMSEWLDLAGECLKGCREWSDRSAELEEKTRELRDFKKGLADLLIAAGLQVEGCSLSALDRKADEFLKDQRDADFRRKELEDRIREGQQQVLAQQRELSALCERLDAWKKAWAEALVPVGLDDGATPEQARAVLARFAELAGHARDIEEKSSRVRAIESDNSRFEASVEELAEDLGREMAGAGHAEYMEQLNRELQEGLEIRERRLALTRKQRDLRKSLEYHRSIVSVNEEEIRALLSEAGCEDPSLLPGREALSAEYREKTGRADELRRIISRSAGGADLDGFLREIAAADADVLPREIAEIQEEIEELERERTELSQEIGRLDKEREGMAGTSTASRVSQEMESVLAAIRDAVQDYARLVLAVSGIRGSLERYRRKNQGQVLTRAGEFFRKITLGSLHGLAADFDGSDRQVLVGLRNGSRVPVEAMSEGTCDQLFLALRLASLEQRLMEREPMPLILDDILVNFDDPRAVQTLRILADISNHTQVILFTHHRHLCDLAGESIPPDILHIQEL